MTHVARSVIFETSPGGILGEEYRCSCGAQSTAAQIAGTYRGRAMSALFGHRPCIGVLRLHASGEDIVVVKE